MMRQLESLGGNRGGLGINLATSCACGLSLDRDHRAAINILIKAGWDTPLQPNVGDCAVRVVEAAGL